MDECATPGGGADAYRTIGEVAEELKLPQHVLRFWETRFPEIRPLKRAGGRRFYRPDDLALLRAIKARLYGEGYTIKGVQRLLQERGAPAVAAEAAAGRAVPSRADPGPADSVSIQAPAPRRDPPPAPTPPDEAAPRHDALLSALSRLEALARDLEDCAELLAAARAVEG